MSSASSEVKPKDLWKAFGGLVAGISIFFAAQLILVVVLSFSSVDVSDLSSRQNLLIGLAGALLMTAMSWGFAATRSKNAWLALGFARPRSPVVSRIVAAAFLYMLVTVLLSALVAILVPGFDVEQEQDLGLAQPTTSFELAGIFTLLVIAAPVAEELLFRGIVFSGMSRSWGFFPAAAISSILFGFAHWQPNVAIATAVLGWLLAWLYARTQSIWPSIFLHSLKNGLAFALIYL